MYSTARRLSTISAIFCAINAMATILFFLYLANCELGFTFIFTAVMYLVSSTIISLLLTISLRDICQDCQTEYEYQTKRLRELNNKIKELENRIK